MARRRLVPDERPAAARVFDSRVRFVLVPQARRLMCITLQISFEFSDSEVKGAIVWLNPGKASDLQVQQAVELLEHAGAAVRVLPRTAEDLDLPAAAGSPAPLSDVSEVRPVVAELVAELPEELRADVAAFIEDRLSEAGL